MNDPKEIRVSRAPKSLSFEGVQGRTEQHHAAGTRVDAVLRRYATTGPEGRSMDVFRSAVAKMPFGVMPSSDYQSMLNEVRSVQSYFERLPVAMRERFRHDPAQMLRFMADPKNLAEATKLGLFRSDPVPPPAPPAPPPAPPVPPSK